MKLTEEEKNQQRVAKMVLMNCNPYMTPEKVMTKDEARKILTGLAMKELEEASEKI